MFSTSFTQQFHHLILLLPIFSSFVIPFAYTSAESSTSFTGVGMTPSTITPLPNDSQNKIHAERTRTTKEAQHKLGGGAINEKQRFYKANSLVSSPKNTTAAENPEHVDFDPENLLSHTLHSLMGLDRYPNYLNRWSSNENDIISLEKSLEKRLQDIRCQRKMIQTRREDISKLVNRVFSSKVDDVTNSKTLHEKDACERNIPAIPSSSIGNDRASLPFPFSPPESWDEVRKHVLHPLASRAIFKSKMFSANDDISVNDIMSGNTMVNLDPSFLEDWIDQEMFDVYSLPLLSHEFCTMLRTIIRKITSIGEETEWTHLSLGRRPVDLDMIGMGWINDLLFHLIIRPISRHLFQDTEIMGGDLDWRHGYVAGYSNNFSSKTGATRERLVAHTDDSEVTLNICIGDDFVGGALRFYGLRGTEGEGELIDEFDPIPGTALLHAGRHLHEVTTVEEGDRYAYIIWARSWSGARAVSCPCCWLNRRRGEHCICAPKWN